MLDSRLLLTGHCHNICVVITICRPSLVLPRTCRQSMMRRRVRAGNALQVSSYALITHASGNRKPHGEKNRTDWYDCHQKYMCNTHFWCHQLHLGRNGTVVNWCPVPGRILRDVCKGSVEQIFSCPFGAFALDWRHYVNCSRGLSHVNNLHKPEWFSAICANANTMQFGTCCCLFDCYNAVVRLGVRNWRWQSSIAKYSKYTPVDQ